MCRSGWTASYGGSEAVRTEVCWVKGHHRSRRAAPAASCRPWTLRRCQSDSDTRAASKAGAVSRTHDARRSSTDGGCCSSAEGAERAGCGRGHGGSVHTSADGRCWRSAALFGAVLPPFSSTCTQAATGVKQCM